MAWRPLLGAALVVLAAAGVLLGHRAAQRPPDTSWVVAVAPIPAGATVGAEDLGVVPIDLPAGIEAVAAEDAGPLIGRVAAREIGAEDLLRPGDVLEPGRYAGPAEVEVALTVDEETSPVEALRPGDHVELLATDPDGTGTRSILSSRVRIVWVDTADRSGGIGTVGGTKVRVAVDGAESARSLVDAARREAVTLVIPAPGPGDTR